MKEKKFRHFEKPLLFLASSFLALALVGCNGAVAINETTIWYGSNQMKGDETVEEHEACHQEQMKEMGGSQIFWNTYFNNPEFRCEVELACGADEDHWGCSGFEFIIQPEERVTESGFTE